MLDRSFLILLIEQSEGDKRPDPQSCFGSPAPKCFGFLGPELYFHVVPWSAEQLKQARCCEDLALTYSYFAITVY